MGEGDGSSVVEIACQCGRSACAEVITLPRCVYEEAQRERGRLLLAPGHELPAFSHRCGVTASWSSRATSGSSAQFDRQPALSQAWCSAPGALRRLVVLA